MHRSDNELVTPDFYQVYYKVAGPTQLVNSVEELPNGLRMIAGWNAADPDNSVNAWARSWSCDGADPKTTTIPDCPQGSHVVINLRFPMCWDGVNIDSTDHRSHMAYGTPQAFMSQQGCPQSHPVYLPEISLIAFYASDGNTDQWYLSSDRMPGMTVQPNGSSFHSDWFGAWDNTVQATWTQECLREVRNCSGGDLGNGTQLEQHTEYTGPQIIAPPS
jgi:hypothetical protein